MCSKRDHFIAAFTSLRTPANRTLWPAATHHRAPHKPLLILAVAKLIRHGMINRNFVEPTDDLSRTFGELWDLLPVQRSGNMVQPFITLQSSGFWNLAPRNEMQSTKPGTIRSFRQLTHHYFGARLHEELFPLLQMQTHRARLVEALVCTYFDPALQHDLTDTIDTPGDSS